MATLKKFKTERTLEERKIECAEIMKQNPLRIPVIVECNSTSKQHHLKKRKFLMEKNKSTVGMLLNNIRTRLEAGSVTAEETIFLLFGNSIASTSTLLSQVYKEHKDEDGFLYVTYCLENTFGSLAK